MVSPVWPEPVIDDEAKVAVQPTGAETERSTVLLKPLIEATLTVAATCFPALVDTEVGDADRVKSVVTGPEKSVVKGLPTPVAKS